MTVTIRHGDCREVLQTLPDQSVHCCVTSPPYFGLRDYGTAKWEGGDAACSHEPPAEWFAKNFNSKATITGTDNQSASGKGRWFMKDGSCQCGATRIDSQIGLEATPDAFVAEMVAVFADVRRVLRDDGTLWLNLGDSYSSSPPGTKRPGASGSSTLNGIASETYRATLDAGTGTKRDTSKLPGLKPKDLIGIPWRVAFALQADGWYLRQDIIWSKPNPMPESVTDRCTKAHEYIFLLSKSARYHYDAKAISEAAEFAGKTIALGEKSFSKGQAAGANEAASGNGLAATYDVPDTRNKRSVWTVTTVPFAEAHFATFPPDLIEPCIKAGCPKGGTVLDPFGGAGTTGLVADRLGRDAILIELNSDYAAMAQRRIEGDAGMFSTVEVEL